MTANEGWQISFGHIEFLSPFGKDLPICTARDPQIPKMRFQGGDGYALGEEFAVRLQDEERLGRRDGVVTLEC